jgi:hypothetical protein
MKLDDNYTLLKDAYCYALHYKGEPYINEKTGKEVIPEKTGYYPSIESCLVAYMNEKIELDNRPIENVLTQIEEIKATIKNSLKKLKTNE